MNSNEKNLSLFEMLPACHIKALKHWNQTSLNNSLSQILQESYTKKEQKNNETYIKNALNQFTPFLDTVPQNPSEFNQWQNEIKSFLTKFILQAPFLTSEEKIFMSNTKVIEASEVFIRQALEYNDNMDFESIGQALRNLWIALIFQIKSEIEPTLTDAIFGYSMLYPLTDNLMDDPGMSANEKKAFCFRLTQRLLHKSVDKQLNAENAIYDMLDLIDSDYPPETFPMIHESLLAIHHAQEQSLIQQKINQTPYTADLLGLSFYKGGTSVLADAYLAKGDLNASEQQFAYEFGALLQLCDDLQDAKTDLKNNHMTIFSQLYKKAPLDSLVNKMLYFSDALLSDEKIIGKIMHKNCKLLILGSSLLDPQILSWRYRRLLKKHMPIRIDAFKKMNKQLTQKITRFKLHENSLKEYITLKTIQETSTNF